MSISVIGLAIGAFALAQLIGNAMASTWLGYQGDMLRLALLGSIPAAAEVQRISLVMNRWIMAGTVIGLILAVIELIVQYVPPVLAG